MPPLRQHSSLEHGKDSIEGGNETHGRAACGYQPISLGPARQYPDETILEVCVTDNVAVFSVSRAGRADFLKYVFTRYVISMPSQLRVGYPKNTLSFLWRRLLARILHELCEIGPFCGLER